MGRNKAFKAPPPPRPPSSARLFAFSISFSHLASAAGLSPSWSRGEEDCCHVRERQRLRGLRRGWDMRHDDVLTRVSILHLLLPSSSVS